MTQFAIIKTGGKQYKVSQGDVLEVEKISKPGPGRIAAEGDVVLDQVLLVADGTDIKIGQPTVKGATVTAKILENAKGEKKTVFRYKAKVRYRKKKGHRQPFTKIQITKIAA